MKKFHQMRDEFHPMKLPWLGYLIYILTDVISFEISQSPAANTPVSNPSRVQNGEYFVRRGKAACIGSKANRLAITPAA